MPRQTNNELMAKRDRDLIAEWNRLCNETAEGSGVPIYSHAYIIEQLQNKFYIQEKRILEIIRNNRNAN